MKISKINQIYVNGSSFSAGGGLEPTELSRYREVLEDYCYKFNLEKWNHEKEVAWPQRLSDKIGIPSINESLQGGGPQRTLRMTYDFIKNNWEQVHNTLFLIEIPNGVRLDLYHKSVDDFLIVNRNDSGETDDSFSFYGTVDYYRPTDDFKNNEENITSDVNFFMNTFYNPSVDEDISMNGYLGFISFCILNKIPMKILGIENKFKKFFPNTLFKEYFVKSPWHYAEENNQLIVDDLPHVEDRHPGYFGHISYANYIYQKITQGTLI